MKNFNEENVSVYLNKTFKYHTNSTLFRNLKHTGRQRDKPFVNIYLYCCKVSKNKRYQHSTDIISNEITRKQNGGYLELALLLIHLRKEGEITQNLFQITTIKRREFWSTNGKTTIVEGGKFNSRFAFRKFLQKCPTNNRLPLSEMSKSQLE